MNSECRAKVLQLQAAQVYIRVCGDEAEVGISPSWDSIGRHEYIAAGAVDEVIKELKQLAEDVLKAAKALEDIIKEVRNRGAEHEQV
jgi:hypothetical protein